MQVGRKHTELEKISSDANSSFRFLYNPILTDVFYWHYHPEIELVYIEGASGTRHVGNHLSKYHHSDLVLVGSNIPHLNFDYKVKSDYRIVVLHIHPDFVNNVFGGIAELTSFHRVFDQSRYGISFGQSTKEKVGKLLFDTEKMSGYDQFRCVLDLFRDLSLSEDYTLLHEEPFVNSNTVKEQERIRAVYAFVENNFHQKISVDEVAKTCNLTKAAFCRFFKKQTGQSFINFLNQYRINHAKKLMAQGLSVSKVCYLSGFESLSYFNRTFKKISLENPSVFRKKHFRN